MKLSRMQLRRLINEAISYAINENAFEQMAKKMFGDDMLPNSGHFVADKSNKEALKIHFGGNQYGVGDAAPGTNNQVKNVMNSIGKRTGKDLKSKDYFIWKGLDKFWSSGMTEMGEVGSRKQDPYLYQKAGGDKFRVVAGPKASTMGKTFTMDKEKQKKFSFGDILSAAMDSSADSLRKSTDSIAKSAKSSGDASMKSSF